MQSGYTPITKDFKGASFGPRSQWGNHVFLGPFITESVQESNCMSATLLSLKCPFKLLKLLGLAHDGPIGEQLVDTRFNMVEDRAYFKIKRIDQFVSGSDQKMFVIRIKENV